MLRLQQFKNSRPQLAHTNPVKKGLMVPPLNSILQCINDMRKRFVIQLLFVSKFMTVWSEVALYKPNLQAFATYSYFTLTAQKMHRRLFHRGGTVTSSARCLGGLCSPAAWGHRTSGHQVPLLQHITTAPRNFSPWHPACLHVQGERRRKETLFRCKDPQESGAAQERQPGRKTGLGTQQFTDPHLWTV